MPLKAMGSGNYESPCSFIRRLFCAVCVSLPYSVIKDLCMYVVSTVISSVRLLKLLVEVVYPLSLPCLSFSLLTSDHLSRSGDPLISQLAVKYAVIPRL